MASIIASIDSKYFLFAIILFLVVVILGTFIKKLRDSKILSGIYYAFLFLFMLCIFTKGYMNKGINPTGLTYFSFILASIKAFTFEINQDFVKELVAVDNLYAWSLYIGVFSCGVTLLFGVLELITSAFRNSFLGFVKLIGLNADIVLGYNEDAIKYSESNKKALLWIDPRIANLTKEDKKKLYDKGIAYVYAPFTSSRLWWKTLLTLRVVDVICFQKDEEYLAIILKTLEKFKVRFKTFFFHVQAKSDHLSFVNEQLTKRCACGNKVMASSFDYYELMSRKFSLDHNLAMYLPNGFIEEGVVKPDREINVVMLGFGKTAKAVLKSIIINNQFVYYDEESKKYKCKKINIELYDESEKAFDDSLVTHIEHFSELCEKDYFNFDPDLGPLELTVNLTHKALNVKSDTSKEFISSLIRNQKDFTFYVVSLTSSVDNSMMAEALSKTVNESSSIIFYNIDDRSQRLLSDSNICIPFGFKNEILSHDTITVEDICTLAKLNNDSYNKKSGKNNDFYAIPIIEKLSNIYKEINLRFKLNLVGLDFVTDNTYEEEIKEKEEYLKYFNVDNYHRSLEDYTKEVLGVKELTGKEVLTKEQIEKIETMKYSEYFKVNRSVALIYQEHLRWAMFYFMYDYKGMKKSQIYLSKEGKIIHKDIPNRKHICITSFDGVDKIHRYEHQFYLDNNINKRLSDVETFKYDMKLDTAYE